MNPKEPIYIRFGQGKASVYNSVTFEEVDHSILVYDLDDQDKVIGLEIVSRRPTSASLSPDDSSEGKGGDGG